jgi:hypothetical protein
MQAIVPLMEGTPIKAHSTVPKRRFSKPGVASQLPKRIMMPQKSLIPKDLLKKEKFRLNQAPARLNEFYTSREFKKLAETKSIHLMGDSDLREMFTFKKYAADF